MAEEQAYSVNTVEAEEDIEKVVEREMAAARENATGGGAGDVEVETRRKPRKLSRSSSKESSSSNSGVLIKPRSWKNSRRSRNGFSRGLPKKGGAGGKGVWGLPGSELLETYEDVNDPNFDPEQNLNNGDIELKAVIPEETYEELKKKIEPIILEYFESADPNEAGLSVEECVPSNRRDIFVQQAIEIAMDHKPSHRELMSVLISDLYGCILNQLDIVKAFENLLLNLSDLVLDIPDAATVLGKFLARAVADDCIPPAFIVSTKEKSDDPLFQEALIHADTLLSMKHGMVRLDNVWGVGGPLRPVQFLIKQMTLLLKEYVSSDDPKEAAQCLKNLEVPHFHHELVYEAVVMALEANNQNTEKAIAKLLKAFSEAVLITQDQMERGFLRVFDDLPDISMDVPKAYVILDRFIILCREEGFLTDNIVRRWPSKGRKRYVSEGDALCAQNQPNKSNKVHEY